MRQDKTRQDKTKEPSIDELTHLRSRAEATLQENSKVIPHISILSTTELQALVHELQVHQTELQMQNEEINKIQNELVESRNRYQDLYDFAPIAYLTVDRNGLILEANHSAASLLGVERKPLLGEPLSRFVSKDDADTFYLNLREVFETPLKLTWEMRLNKQSDGAQINAQVEGVATQGREGNSTAALIISDITGRIHADNKLRDSEQKYKSVLENISVGVSLISPKMEILALNKQMRLWNPSVDEGGGPICYKSFHIPPRNAVCDNCPIWKTLQDGLVHESENETPTGDTLRNYRIVSSPIFDNSGSIIAAIEMVEDITERKKSREERLRLQDQLHQAQKMEAVGVLAGGIAHDFNNLLQIVLGYSEFMIQQKEEGEKDYADIQKIIEAGHRGAELVQSLMIFSRKTESQPTPINLNNQVDQLTKMLSRIIPKMISVELGLAPDLAMINADPTQMDQVVMNLAVNARDAMGDQGNLTIKTENVILDGEYCKTHIGVVPGSYVALRISDTGCGMDKDTLTRIFEPFFTTKEKGKGTGLGLSTVYGIVKQHNGFIDCESDPGHGATFKIYFPAILPKQESSEDSAGETSPEGGTETILIVDDEESLRVMVGRILSRAGYTILTAGDGEEALDLFKREPEKISLVILDLMMPKMGGQKCLEEILRIDPKAKILITTGVSLGDEQTKMAIDSGAKGPLHKPYDNTKLLSVVRTLLDTD